VTGPDFSSTIGALCAVQKSQESDKLVVHLTRHCGKPLVAASAVLNDVYITWKYPRRRVETAFQVTGPYFSFPTGALCAVKTSQESDKLIVDLPRHYGKPLVAASAVPHGVYLTWKYPCGRIEATFQVTGPNCSSTTGALCAVKATSQGDELHAELPRHCGKSLVAASAFLNGV
jgi:hypothetical protein